MLAGAPSGTARVSRVLTVPKRAGDSLLCSDVYAENRAHFSAHRLVRGTMKVPDDLPYGVSQRDDSIEVRKYPILWTILILSPLCALFWIAVIWAVVAWFSW